MRLQLTVHAIQQFAERWRSNSSLSEARAELTVMAQRAVATKRKTLLGDAQVFVVESDQGERIGLAVREGVAVTTLPPDFDMDTRPDWSASPEELDESQATLAACHALLAKDAVQRRQEAADEASRQAEIQRKLSALSLLRAWGEGKGTAKPKAVGRARQTLGIGRGDPLPTADDIRKGYT